MRRPISPHLQIYAIFSKEMTSSLSILHRMTGIGLLVGFVYVLAWIYSLAMGARSYAHFIVFMQSWFGLLSLYGLLACFILYMILEIRFLIFAAGFGLGKKQVQYSGWFAVLAFVVLFALSAAMVGGCFHG